MMLMKSSSRPISIAARSRWVCSIATEEIKPTKPPSLFQRLSPIGSTGESVADIANQYMREGHSVKKREMEQCIRQLRRYKRFQHALELMDWMEKREINFSYRDHAVRINLILKAKDIYAAEEYFNSLPSTAKNKQTYTALLNCYYKENMIERSQALFEKMRELNFATEEKKPQTSRPASLFRTLSPLGATGKNVAQAANQYGREGNIVKKDEVLRCVKILRRYKRFQHALDLMDWMKNRGINLSFSDNAVLIDLISKTKGIDAAEEFFNNLPSNAKNKQAYGALLNCYCKEKMAEKAVALFEKMSELDYASTSLAYNNLMTLYMRLGEPEKVPALAQEMKEKDIPLHTFTYNILMNCYSALKDIPAVERVMKEMQTKDSDKCDWTTYTNLAAVYVEAGLFEKAESALKETEKMLKHHGDRQAYHFLISLYARTSNLTEIHRVWNALKLAHPNTVNLSYLCMLQALAKLDDFDELKKCFEEWVSGCSHYDMKLTNVVISAYLRRDMFKEAKLLCDGAVKRGSGPNAKTHEIFMDFFLRSRQPAVAMNCMESAISYAEWRPKHERVETFFKLFQEEKDIAGAEMFSEMLRKVNCLDSEVYRLLLLTYVSAGKREPEMRRRIKADDIDLSSEIEDLLESVCPKYIDK